MANKRRPRKVRPPYKRYVGTGLLHNDEAETGNSEEEEETDAKAELTERVGELTYLNISHSSDELLDPSNLSGLHLPPEILDKIFGFCPNHFPLLFVNRSWCAVALPHLYYQPKLRPNNFADFVEAISRKGGLGYLVRDLDLVHIAQTGKNSMTSRLLRRCSARLERFIAPQSHFGLSPVISLKNCQRLKILDLGLVTETVDLPKLLHAVEEFQELEALYFPRSSIKCGDDYELRWPPNLRYLGLAGGLTPAFLANTVFPSSLSDLTVSNCPYVTGESILSLLAQVGKTIRNLTIQYPMPLLKAETLDPVLILCPYLVSLRVSIDYISNLAIDSDNLPTDHPLRNLRISSSGMMGHADKIKPSDVLLATECLTKLCRVSTSLQLGWNPRSLSLAGLVETLEERGGGVWFE